MICEGKNGKRSAVLPILGFKEEIYACDPGSPMAWTSGVVLATAAEA